MWKPRSHLPAAPRHHHLPKAHGPRVSSLGPVPGVWDAQTEPAPSVARENSARSADLKATQSEVPSPCLQKRGGACGAWRELSCLRSPEREKAHRERAAAQTRPQLPGAWGAAPAGYRGLT